MSLSTYVALLVLAGLALWLGIGWLAAAIALFAGALLLADTASPAPAPKKQAKPAPAQQTATPQYPPMAQPYSPTMGIASALMTTVATDWFTTHEKYQEALKEAREKQKTGFLSLAGKEAKTLADVVKAIEKLEKKLEKD